MNVHDIIRMAREAGLQRDDDRWFSGESATDVTTDDLERFAALVAAAEREACAQLCDAEASIEGIAQRCAAAIRARQKENPPV